MEKTKQSKVLYLDILRAIACIMVVLYHCTGEYNEINSSNFWASNIVEAFSQIGVPLFLMISGALMLNKDYHCTTQKIKKHITKMLIFFLIWSALYCLRFIISGELNMWGLLTDFIIGPYHLWFVPMIIGIYLIVPLLRLWVKNENKRYIEYYLILSLIFTSIVPNTIDHLSTFSSAFEVLNYPFDQLGMNYVLGFTGYFILGWYLNTFDFKYKKTAITIGALGVIIAFSGTGVLSIVKGEVYSIIGNFNLGIILYAIGVFLLIKSIFANKTYNDNIFYSLINLICNCSLGIYAIHAAIVSIAYDVINFETALLQIPIHFTVSIVISFSLAWLLKKIPFLKKII